MAENTIANRTLFIADNLDVLRGMNSGTVDLIYLDPPFNSGKEWSAPVGSLAAGAAFKDAWTLDDVKEEWVDEIEERNPALHYIIKGAGFASSNAMQGYLTYMAIRLLEMHRVLKSTGSIYLHCDSTADSYLRTVLDAIFGRQNFRNEIVWQRMSGTKSTANRFFSQHDSLLYFVKSGDSTWNRVLEPLTQEEIEASWFRYTDADGRRYKVNDLTSPSKQGGYEYEFLGAVRRWRYPLHKMNQLLADGEIHHQSCTPGAGNIVAVRKRYLDEMKGRPLGSVWTDVKTLNRNNVERTGYPTQKPLALLERIIKASSQEGDLVLDPFCGCATTCVAAERLGREWIGIDVSEKAYDLVVSRLAKDAQVGSTDLAQGQQQPIGLYGQVVRRMDLPKRTDLPPAAKGGRSAHIKRTLYEAQGGKCNGCEWSMPIHALAIDHIHPRAAEGPDVDSNLQLLCPSCNSIKGARIMPIEQLREETRLRGTHIEQGDANDDR